LGAQLTLLQPEGAEYTHHITGSTPGFGNLTTALDLLHNHDILFMIPNVLMEVEEQLERFRVTCSESFAIRPVRNVNKSKFIFVKI
jgi:hypothetical protein